MLDALAFSWPGVARRSRAKEERWCRTRAKRVVCTYSPESECHRREHTGAMRIRHTLSSTLYIFEILSSETDAAGLLLQAQRSEMVQSRAKDEHHELN